MRAKLRLAVPWPFLVPPALGYLVFVWIMYRWGGQNDSEIQKIVSGILFVTAAVVGAVRACVFHPFYRKNYREWLETTPWTVDKPLPFGPIELDWVDGVIPAVLILAYGLVPNHESARILAVYLFAHCLFLTVSIWGAANHVPAYASLFGLGLMVRLWPHAWPCAATGVVVYLIVYDGLRISLRDFPWKTHEPPDARPQECGWPYDRLLKDPQDAGDHSIHPLPAGTHQIMALKNWGVAPRVLDHFLMSLLVCWWISSVNAVLPDDSRFGFLTLSTLATIGLSMLSRALVYSTGYSSPMSVWGRLWTGRWVIPGYDVVLLGIILIPVVPLVILGVCLYAEIPLNDFAPVLPAAALFVALTCPPGLRRWRLTGWHRLSRTAVTGETSSSD